MSDKPVILVTRKLPDAVEARLKSDYEARLNPDAALYSKAELIERVQGAQGILPCHTEKFDSDMIAQLPNDVKIIANFSVGVDHCDLAAAKDKGIVITNTPDVLSDATAEIAILLLLGAARRAGEGETLGRTRTWKDWSPSFMVGVQVTGKRLGIVGMGRVGQMVARRAKCFGMEIHYHNRSRLAPDLEDGAIYHNNLEDMLPLCQFLSLNCPNTPETAGMLNAGVISQLPDGAVVINTARGGVVDDDALIGALASGKLAAAGLDVFNNEPDIHTGYRDLKNTFLLPHIGSATAETRDAMGFRALDNLDAYFAGREPGDRVA